MTKEEALRILDTIPTKGEVVDALEMAIEALEQKVDISTNTPTENDYIRRQAAIANYQHVCITVKCGDCPFRIEDGEFTDCRLERFLHELPSAQHDVVEVVRCRECKHGRPYKHTKEYVSCEVDCEPIDRDSDFFCADGKRRLCE